MLSRLPRSVRRAWASGALPLWPHAAGRRILPAVRVDRSDIIAFLVGFVSLPAQAILLRELLGRDAGNELALTIYLALWLAGSALGARFWEAAVRDRGGAVRTLLPLGLLIATLAVAAARAMPIPGAAKGEIIGPEAILLLGLLTLFPASFFTVGLFPLAARQVRSAGRAYMAEAAGALAAGLATTILFIARVPPIAILGISWACLIASLSRRLAAPAAALLLIAAIASGWIGDLDHALFRAAWEARHPGMRLTAHAHTPSRVLAMAEREGERLLYQNDAPFEAIDDPYEADAVAALLLAVGEGAHDLLLVGFGGSSVAPSLARAGVRSVTCLLPDREDTLLAGRHPSVVYRIGDARAELRTMSDRYDLIAISGPMAASLGSNRTLTLESFRAMGRRLRARGGVVVIAPGGAAASGPEASGWRASVARALHEAVGHLEMIEADRIVLAASPASGAVSLVADSLRARLARSGHRLATYPPERFALEYPAERRTAWPAVGSPSPRGILTLDAAPSNRDARPSALAHALRWWGRRSGIHGAWPRTLPYAALALVALAVLMPWARGREAGGMSALVATGATAMGLDLLVLMTYQTRVGLLQSGLGALLGAFLGGMAVGAWIAGRLARGRRSLSGACVAQGVLGMAAAFLLPRFPAGDAFLSTILFVVAALLLGASCGFPFPIVAGRASAAKSWAADSIGGMLGAILVLALITRGLTCTGIALAALPLLALLRIRTRARDRVWWTDPDGSLRPARFAFAARGFGNRSGSPDAPHGGRTPTAPSAPLGSHSRRGASGTGRGPRTRRMVDGPRRLPPPR